MCGTCESDHSGRWTSTRVIVLVFLVALLALSAAGVVARARSPEPSALGTCAAASSAAVRFQSKVTRDLGHHGRLHSDAVGFARELRSLGALRCPEMMRFLRSAEQTLDALCDDCVVILRTARPTSA